MKLFYNTASPYARKALVAAHETGLIGRLDLCLTDPWTDPAELLAVNPVGKVPALLCDDGAVVTESTTIGEFLDTLTPARPLTGHDRAGVMARAALAEGVIDAAFTAVIEGRRPPERQWQDWIDRQQRAIERTLSVIEAPPAGRFDLGDIALACALGYLDFRLGDTGWRGRHAALGRWLDGVAARPSMQATRP
jgi:glutathione S-transferase